MQIQLSLFNLQADSTGRREETCLHSPAATYFKNQQDGKSCCANYFEFVFGHGSVFDLDSQVPHLT